MESIQSLHPFLPNLDEETIAAMLKKVGAQSLDELFADIPEDLKLKRKLRIPDGEAESSIRREMSERLSANRTPPLSRCFLGGGVWPHYVPAAVDAIVSRQEFYTSYTPYQPEISQGMLQVLFEYQSLMCDLLGMAACNSSMYDWASAAGEAVRMAVRVKQRKTILVGKNVGPERLDVIRTYVSPLGLELRLVGYDRKRGTIDLASLRSQLSQDVAGLYVENPNYFGVIEDGVAEAMEMVHGVGALGILGVDPISLAVLREPGDYGADIVVGEGQPLGIPMNYGGPHIGIFAVKEMGLARSMPGRLIGMTTTKDGRDRAFCMVLQTREQHIRREAATSNICTNQALLAVAASTYLSLLGKRGFKRLGEVILAKSHFAASRLAELGDGAVVSPLFEGAFFKEFVVGYRKGNCEDVYARLAQRGILGGYPLTRRFGELGEAGAFCVTEVHSTEDIMHLVGALKEDLTIG
jgi:glycine dehydrogenase subunit 1